jgi:A/G-specific adenine glycosylase
MDFAFTLIEWYNQNKRQLPWRETDDPYKIWLSEIIMQQTRINQGLAYYNRLSSHFPTIRKLAEASEVEVLKLWQGLGYYSRARNLHFAAKTIVEKFNGHFPQSYTDIISLKGIGPYTAAAITSIAFNQPFPVVDGNVTRVISRWFAITEAVNSSFGKRKIETAVKELIVGHSPGTFNQAIMEFGALYCKPKNPECGFCIFSISCLAFQKGLVAKVPVKLKSHPQKKRFFNYLFITDGDEGRPFVYLNKRTEGDIWQGLYDFPLIETEKETDVDNLMNGNAWKEIFKESKPVITRVSRGFKHQLTHQQIFAKFIKVNIQENLTQPLISFVRVELKNVEKYPIPRLIELYLNKNNISR